jgi:hypothetical protein
MLYVSTCSTAGIAGATCTGNTYLRLINATGTTVASNTTISGCGGCSYLTSYVNPSESVTYVTIRQSCYPVQGGACSGTTAYAVFQYGEPPARRRRLALPLPPPRPPPAPLAPSLPPGISVRIQFLCRATRSTPTSCAKKDPYDPYGRSKRRAAPTPPRGCGLSYR